MKIMTTRRVLVDLKDVPFTAKTFDTLLVLSVMAPNLAIEAVEVHTNHPMKVRLYQIDFNWQDVNTYNLAVA